ncbi:MAG: 4-hydroxybutyryl-CoA dehydratase [Alphaproteobacteria bacterium]|jgi:4-hydroxybutyryl-CoA dehydratase / vinylacetyl-CoA-Delta-isomerase|nr:4-hydroxybutyryl-CoA dehydratase [Alphaproteobacteria bacterium]MBT4086270.1 4-hydroxybutyryl-CoA dehydratase [Alphaproteobacteria bacterium]MBT4543887.1 4-hydroxybutyryl-CoA dehydratase [Alphaproteobacteria bacterium]MBT7745256.1 4-hydroxybutyryl-CoA dehydratase [Alphaproteobacteria bacterium]
MSSAEQIIETDAEDLRSADWGDYDTISGGDDYIDSLRGRPMKVWLFGECLEEPVDHPMISTSINSMAETYKLAQENPAAATAQSPYTGDTVNRFLHIHENAGDLVAKARMQRDLGSRTGTCFQRCVGLDAINSLHSVTYETDEVHGTDYHARFLAFLAKVQKKNQVIGGAMTDAKGDRSKAPHQQVDPDVYLHISERREDGVVVRGVKCHQTGCINSHWLIVMPTIRLTEEDKDFAIVGAVPAHAEGITYIYGRQSNDSRSMEDGDIDAGNATFAGQEAMIIFDDVFIPYDRVFMNGEYDFAAPLVERFTTYHRCSYICKTGVGDVLIGAAAEIADMNGVAKASHIKDKLIEMAHLNETIAGSALASAHEARPMKSGVWQNDDMHSNVCKQNVTRFPYEIARLAQDLAGGLMVTLPSEQDLENDEVGPLIRKFLIGRENTPVEDRMRILRLIENMTLGRNAVGYLTESMHGAGSPQAQRVQIARGMNVGEKRSHARRLAGIKEDEI